MKKKEINLSSKFKNQAIKAIVALVFFAFTYLIILLLAIVLTVLCITGGVLLIAIKPMFLTIALGIGLASLGVLILVFLLKFIFKSHKVDRSHLVEVSRLEEPKLFSLIDEIVREVKTSSPKKVYLSTEVNAAVFYDSSFWSMFFPIKKNLQIGLGLVNTISKKELKAILSHEFGHFSQRTMKVGSYVYNVNQIIFNMLYDNESYNNLVQNWANVSGYFSIFVSIAVKINEGIQWVLRKLYEIVNKNYLGLSREMEFHADEIAASVTGYEPLKNSLLRMSLADASFNNVLNFYNSKIANNIISENIYRDQTAVFNLLAEINSMPFKNGLPEISLEEQSKFDKSKLIIKNQWASHPTVRERISALEKTGFSMQDNSYELANEVFVNFEETQRKLTAKLFKSVIYQDKPAFISFDKFKEEYSNGLVSNSFSKKYNGYYDNKNPNHFELNNTDLAFGDISLEDLFSDEKVDLVYNSIALQNDIETLISISNNSLGIKTFDYDGSKYKRKDAERLIESLKMELEVLNNKILKNDTDIYNYFKHLENEQKRTNELEHLYFEFFEFDMAFESRYNIYIKLLNDLQFVTTTTPFEQIKENLARIRPIEEDLKKEINQLLSDNRFQDEITKEVRGNLEQYTSQTWEYFGLTKYFDENLDLFYNAMHNYAYVLSRGYFILKNRILEYQDNLIKSNEYNKTSVVNFSEH